MQTSSQLDHILYKHGLLFSREVFIELRPGWIELFEQLCDEVALLVKEKEIHGFHWTSIEEKFGKLNVEYFCDDPSKLQYVFEVEQKYSIASGKTCAMCGSPGEMVSCNGLHVLCSICKTSGV